MIRLGVMWFFVLGLLPAVAGTCLVTQIHWHVSTSEGMTVGVTEIVWGCEDGGGTAGGGTSTGGEGPGGGDPGTTQEPGEPCIWPNSLEFVTDLHEVVAFSEWLPFGDDPTRPDGFHYGVDLFVPSGTPIFAPCDGVLTVGREDIGRDCLGSQGNYLSIQPSGSWGAPPKGSGGEVVPGSIIAVQMSHLDENWATRAGVTDGMFIHKGQRIGYTDNTGPIKNLDAHLHMQYVDSFGDYHDPQEVADCVRN